MRKQKLRKKLQTDVRDSIKIQVFCKENNIKLKTGKLNKKYYNTYDKNI